MNTDIHLKINHRANVINYGKAYKARTPGRILIKDTTWKDGESPKAQLIRYTRRGKTYYN